MPESKAPVQGDLLEALDALTGLIAEHEQRSQGFSALDGEHEPDLEGFDFGPAMDHEPIPLLEEVVHAPQPELPDRAQLEALVDEYLDGRLAELREQLKREIFIELRRRYPHL